MGRSQRHKVLEQGISSSQETEAEGVGEPWPGTTYNERGNPVGSGPGSNLTGAPEGNEVQDELPLTYGDSGGPLRGSAVQSAYSAGGEKAGDWLAEGGGGGGTEPEPEPDPTLTAINPTSLTVNTGPQTITVIGTDFADTDTVNLDGLPVSTTFVSETELYAVIPTDGVPPGPMAVTVWFGSGMTNAIDLTFA